MGKVTYGEGRSDVRRKQVNERFVEWEGMEC